MACSQAERGELNVSIKALFSLTTPPRPSCILTLARQFPHPSGSAHSRPPTSPSAQSSCGPPTTPTSSSEARSSTRATTSPSTTRTALPRAKCPTRHWLSVRCWCNCQKSYNRSICSVLWGCRYIMRPCVWSQQNLSEVPREANRVCWHAVCERASVQCAEMALKIILLEWYSSIGLAKMSFSSNF